MGRVRTKTVKKASRVIIEKYYTKLTLDFDTNKRIIEEVAIIPSKPLRNKVRRFQLFLDSQEDDKTSYTNSKWIVITNRTANWIWERNAFILYLSRNFWVLYGCTEMTGTEHTNSYFNLYFILGLNFYLWLHLRHQNIDLTINIMFCPFCTSLMLIFVCRETF